ncbi:hypothetical protein HFD88_005699 [Aspergillus terreus]|nr:hypothetical protein HFD88_005699 [Aspergillus terreus]
MADILTPFELAVQHLERRNAHPYNQRLSQKRRKTRMQGIDEFGRYIVEDFYFDNDVDVHADKLDGYKARNPSAGFENNHEALEDMWLEENARLHELEQAREQAREQAESTDRAPGSSSMSQNVSEQPAVEPRDTSTSKEKKSTTQAEGSSRSERSQEKAQRRTERAKKKKQKQERAEASAS